MSMYLRWKFTVLLAATMLVIAGRMTLAGSLVETLVLDACSIVLVFAAILAICAERHFRLAALILGTPMIVMLVATHLFPDGITWKVRLVSRYWGALFLAFTVVMIVRTVLTAPHVTWDTVVGAFTGYVLIGILWTQLYCAIDLIDPAAFAVAGSPRGVPATPLEQQAVLEYFSFATLSTVGYGDVTPVSQVTRSLASIEAICGQFYLAVLVAGLIGIRGQKGDRSI